MAAKSRNLRCGSGIECTENSEGKERPFGAEEDSIMGVAQYAVTPRGHGWTVLHDGHAKSDYATREAAFEAAVAAASLAIREGHDIDIKVSSRPT
jgi:hypothetical protein